MLVVGPGKSLATQEILSPLRGPPGVLDPSRSLVRLRALGPCRSMARPGVLRPCGSLVRVKARGPRKMMLETEFEMRISRMGTAPKRSGPFR